MQRAIIFLLLSAMALGQYSPPSGGSCSDCAHVASPNTFTDTNTFDTHASPAKFPLSIRGGGSAGNYTLTNSGIVWLDATGGEIGRLQFGDPNVFADFNSGNLYLGYQAGLAQPTDNTSAGSHNSGFGLLTLAAITTGFNNNANGTFALQKNTSGDNNNGQGFNALGFNTTGRNNAAIGSGALSLNITGSSNSGVGHIAGASGFADNSCTFLGAESDRDPDIEAALTNCTAIGFGAIIDASNAVSIGNDSVIDTRLRGARLISGTRPACGASNRGQFWYVAGGAGVQDTVSVCAKDAADSFSWRTLY